MTTYSLNALGLLLLPDMNPGLCTSTITTEVDVYVYIPVIWQMVILVSIKILEQFQTKFHQLEEVVTVTKNWLLSQL